MPLHKKKGPGWTEAPEACESCRVKPVLRRACKTGCGLGEYVIKHERERCEYWKIGGEEVIQVCVCRVGADGRNGRPITTPEMAKQVAQNLAKGMSIRGAMMDAGYTANQSRNGPRSLNKMIWTELKTVSRKYIDLGRCLNAEEQECLVRGRLMENTIKGTDKGVMSAKQLGADKRVSMWVPDSQVGLVVLQAPEPREVKHSVPWMESKHKEEEEPE